MRTELTFERAHEALRYLPETGELFWANKIAKKIIVGSRAATRICADGYTRVAIDGTQYLAHRVIWLLMTGQWPKHEIDHIDRDRANNRWCNLREATRQQNLWNTTKRPDNKSGYKGVSWHKQSSRWRARMAIDGKYQSLGLFLTPEDAFAEICRASAHHRGSFNRVAD